jgi:hypothetical protein
VWVCPVCAPEIRSARGTEIALAVELHLLGGGGVEFGTATMPHEFGHRLRDTYSVVAKAWNSVGVDKSVRAFRKSHGYWGFVRTCEVTYGQNAGWHPHVHWLDFWEEPLTTVDRSHYVRVVLNAWRASVIRQGFGSPSDARGVRILPVREAKYAEDVGRYMTAAKAGHELTNLTTKEARRSGMAPFEILALARSSEEWCRVWWEYEGATRGRRMLGRSQKLFQRLGLSLDDPEPVEAGPVVGYVTSEEWGQLRWFGGGVEGVQGVVEAAAVRGHVGIREAMAVLLGAVERVLELPDSVQLVLGPGDDGGMF